MPVVGINFHSIKAERKREVKGNLKINNTPRIENIGKKELKEVSKTALSLEFEYKCEYLDEFGDNPPKASIQMKGEILFITDNLEEIIKKWEEDKNIPEKVALPVLNNILRKCIRRGIEISEDLQLPPPIKFPVARKEEKENKDIKYIG